MSARHPIVAITGSSGSGTTTVKDAFDGIFCRDGIHAVHVAGNSFRRYDDLTMQRVYEESLERGNTISFYGPEANLFDRLEGLFREYSHTGRGLARHYIDDAEQAETHGRPVGTFTPWEEITGDSDLLFYEGLHGGCIEATWSYRPMSPSHNPVVVKERHKLTTRLHNGVDVARWVDLLIGVVPSINLEWIQKIHRDTLVKGASKEAVTAHILRHMRDYIRYITPQFSLTDINFQRIPLVDTSDPFDAREIPALSESMVVIRFRDPKSVDFPRLLNSIDGAFMSRPNTLVVPGGEMENAMELICAPIVHELVQKARALREL